MSKFRKKPIIIDAFKWTGGPDQTEDPLWVIEALENATVWFETHEAGVVMVIKTLEGNHIANKGDYIIRGIKGEIYPCKPDIFELTYEQVDKE